MPLAIAATRVRRVHHPRVTAGHALRVVAIGVALSAVSCSPSPRVSDVVAGASVRLAPAPQIEAPPQPTPTAQPATPALTLPPTSGSTAAVSVAFSARTPTRVVVPSLGIDVPVVAPSPTETFPLCDVAEYLPSLSRPGFAGATYLYAHARVGMFLPLLEASIYDEAKLRRAEVRVYTDDDEMFTYRVSEVRRGQSPAPASLVDALTATTEQLWLQTSEGTSRSSTKLIVIARPDGRPVAVSKSDAHPTPHPYVCS